MTTIVKGADEVPRVYKAWTDDISPSGALIQCEQPIESDEICVRVFLPGLQERFFNCRIVRRDEYASTSFNRAEITRYLYGVEFLGVCGDAEMDFLMKVAAGA